MRIFEVEGESPEEILTLFAKQQNISREYIEYEVIEAGSKGLLGIGRRTAKVKIKYNDTELLKKRSRIVLSDFLEKAGFGDTHIEVREEKDKIILDINTLERPDILIGKSSQTLDSLQYLIDKMLKIEDFAPTEILIDVGGYRVRCEAQGIENALKIAEQVKRTGRPVRLEPMVTSMRKAIHVALKKVDGVSTVSTGEGQIKQINIIPDKKR